jgi:hypothetical protein
LETDLAGWQLWSQLEIRGDTVKTRGCTLAIRVASFVLLFTLQVQSQSSDVVTQWLFRGCSVGEAGILEAQLAQLGSTALPTLAAAAQNGPDSTLISAEQDRAASEFAELSQSYANASQYGISSTQIQDLQSITVTDYVTQAVQNFVLRYESAAAAGLGIVGGTQAIAILQSFAKNTSSPLQAVAQQALLNLSAASGSVHARLLGQGAQASGTMYVDLQLSSDGPADARNLKLTSLKLHTVSGTGTVTLIGPTTPLVGGYLPAGGVKVVRVDVGVPAGVTQFSMTENFTLQNGTGKIYNYSQVQVVTP